MSILFQNHFESLKLIVGMYISMFYCSIYIYICMSLDSTIHNFGFTIYLNKEREIEKGRKQMKINEYCEIKWVGEGGWFLKNII